MALIKEIELDNGIITNYHRIDNVLLITNKKTIINVLSYTSKEKRIDEINYDDNSAFKHHKQYDLPYDKEMNVDKSYDYLKTLDEYKGAIDD